MTKTNTPSITQIDAESHKQISMVVLTGGPCAGKTTAASKIESAFSKLGYKLLFVPETATELITGGVTPWGMSSNIDFQYELMKLQLHKEDIYLEAAKYMPEDKILIVCDRGLMDSQAYMQEDEFTILLNRLGISRVEARDRYDAVFHLVTAAKGAEQFYTTSNNAARTETVEQAAALDDKLVYAWTGHPHLRIIDNSAGFEIKLQKLIREISVFLGEPEPFEIERKFLIRYPDLQLLNQLQNCEKIDIMQTYLTAPDKVERRVRQRGSDGNYIYVKTEKRNVSDIKRIETETKLTQKEYLSLLMEADPALSPIHKKRYCLTFQNQYMEIDIYPFWQDRAIVEVELNDENQEIHFPEYLEVIREVTDDSRYKNRSLASSHEID